MGLRDLFSRKKTAESQSGANAALFSAAAPMAASASAGGWGSTAAGRTQNYGLNQWEATDKPCRHDFNYDNYVIDEALGELNAGKVNGR
ncbi:MAG: hypothetical protein LBV27_03990, partial [Oscillospiraceae bacterium]|nr:hypothetical protein [Oscillospiraceae bacterium]